MDRHAGVSQHSLNQRGENLDMRARGDLRYHPAIGLVSAALPDNRLRKDAPIGSNQRGGAVIARAFKTQNYGRHCSHFASGPLPEGAPMH